MTTLAQSWLEKHDPSPYDEWLTERLAKPHVLSSGNVLALADRIVVAEDVTDLMYEMGANKQIIFGDMFRHTRMPSEVVWIEWRDAHTPLELGVLLDTRAKKRSHEDNPCIGVLVVVRSLKSGRTQVMFSGSLDCLPMTADDIDNQCELAWTYHDANNKDVPQDLLKDAANEFARSLSSAIFTLFVMQHPKLVERTPVSHGSALQKKRAKHGKPPLLDYSRVYIKINKSVPAHIRKGMRTGREGMAQGHTSLDEVTRRKYHKVLGHFRTYHRGEPEETVKWIAEHWRGDPTLGVVLHEHRVTKGDA